MYITGGLVYSGGFFYTLRSCSASHSRTVRNVRPPTAAVCPLRRQKVSSPQQQQLVGQEFSVERGRRFRRALNALATVRRGAHLEQVLCAACNVVDRHLVG